MGALGRAGIFRAISSGPNDGGSSHPDAVVKDQPNLLVAQGFRALPGGMSITRALA